MKKCFRFFIFPLTDPQFWGCARGSSPISTWSNDNFFDVSTSFERLYFVSKAPNRFGSYRSCLLSVCWFFPYTPSVLRVCVMVVKSLRNFSKSHDPISIKISCPLVSGCVFPDGIVSIWEVQTRLSVARNERGCSGFGSGNYLTSNSSQKVTQSGSWVWWEQGRECNEARRREKGQMATSRSAFYDSS